MRKLKTSVWGMFMVCLLPVLPAKGSWEEMVTYRSGDWQWVERSWYYDAGADWFWAAEADSWVWFQHRDWLDLAVGRIGSWLNLENNWYFDAGDGWHWLADGDVWLWVNEADAVTPVPAEMVLVEGGALVTTNALNGTNVETFYIGRFEVTWGEWQAVQQWAIENGYTWPSAADNAWGDEPIGCGDDHPVHTLSWFDVLKWCNAKSEMAGLVPVYTVEEEVFRSGEPGHLTIVQDLSANGYRLPLEAEWEFAARGGNQSNGYTFSGSNDLNEVAWYWRNSAGAACDLWWGSGTWPVGLKAANELGLHDMTGNVSEWIWDAWGIDRRRHRGGSWGDEPSGSGVALRSGFAPQSRGLHIGFRLARTAEN